MAIQPRLLDAYDEDRDLVTAFQAGEESAFGLIVRAHYAALLRTARRRLGSPGDSEDAVQETFLRAYLALDRFAGEFNLRAWLHRILANVCADIMQRRTAHSRLRDRLATRREVVPPAEEAVGDAALQRIIGDAIASLPEAYRVAFVLREVEEKSYSEVAETMAVTEENARARVHRARSSLARTLRDVGATFGTFAIPFRLLVRRWLPARFSSLTLAQAGARHAAHGLARPARLFGTFDPGALTATGGSGLPPDLTAVTSGPLQSLSLLSATPIPQALTQAVSTPVAQTLLAAADVGRSALPVAGAALATLAAGVAAVLPGPGALRGVAGPVPIAASTPDSSGGSGSSLQLTDASPAASPVPTSLSTSSTMTPSSTPAASSTGNTSKSSGSSGSSTPAATTTTASSQPSGPWSWVPAAASGNGPSTSAAPATGTTSAATPEACPFAQSFPIYAPGPVSLRPPEPAGTTQTGSFVMNEVSSPANAGVLNGNSTGTVAEGGDGGTAQASFGVCMAGPNYPMLVANLASTDPGNPSQSPVLQVEGALVSSSTSSQGTTALFRGQGLWLTGPDSDQAEVPLVAEVITSPAGSSQTQTVSILVAFFAPVPGLVDPGGTSSSTSAVSLASSSSTGSPAANSSDSTTSGSDASAPAAGTTSTDPEATGSTSGESTQGGSSGSSP